MRLTIISQYHPAAALHQPRLWASMLDDWEHLPEKVDADFAIVEQTAHFTVPVALDTERAPDGSLGQWSVAYRDVDGQLKVSPYYGTVEHTKFDDLVIFHNAKYDLNVLRNNGMSEPKNIADTMIAAYCLLPKAKILYRDLTWHKIGEAKVGDELIGVEEELTPHKRRKMLPSKILSKHTRVAECFEIKLNDGRILTSTADHRWLAQTNGGNKSTWRRTDNLRVGWRIPSSLIPWEIDSSYRGGYLAGILDGEGWVNAQWLSVGIAQNPGAVLEESKRILDEKGFQYSESKATNSKVHRLNLSGNRTLMRLLGSLRPRRLLAKEFWNGKSPWSKNQPVLRILEITSIGKQEVVSIETTTHTFNAEGCWTHNCLGYGFQDVKDSAKGKSGDQMVGGLGLKYLARRHLGLQMKTWQEIKDEPENIPEYNAMDSVATYLLFEKWKPQLPEHFWTIDMPLLRPIMAMEDRGIQVDPSFLKKFAETLDKRLKEIDLPVNPFAPEEVRGYLYGFLGIEPWKFTSTGAPSTDAEVLETIDDPVVKQILEYKSLYKERGTYAGSYMKQIGLDGRIHCEFKQTRTATGRLSSANPNLQNVVKDGDMRKLFIAPEGKTLLRLDYKQMELVMFAIEANEERMLEAILKGRDIHQETADALGIDRPHARNVNFLMLYGGGAWKMSREFHVTIDSAKAMIKKYYEAFPGIQKYHEEQEEICKSEKRVYDWAGRMRRLDAMYAEDWRIRQEGVREGINMPIQGGAGEVTKLAMIDLHYKHSAPMILQVHDELLFEVDQKDAKDYAHWLKSYVPAITQVGGVSFPVDIGIGSNWAEASLKENEM